MKKIVAILLVAIFLCLAAHAESVKVTTNFPKRQSDAISGSEFIAKAMPLKARKREKAIMEQILKGNFPEFMRHPVEIKTSIEIDGREVPVSYFVLPDYLMVGNDDNFVRTPMIPSTAQLIADAFGCFIATPKICDDVHKAAVVKLEPRPLTKDRDAWATMVHHDSIVESQRQGAKGLIAGIKKEVVLTDKLIADKRPNRLALYGWHKLDGKPIQPVFTGHIDYYVDYSHGFRFVLRTILIDGKPYDYTQVLADEKLRPALTNEPTAEFTRYKTMLEGR